MRNGKLIVFIASAVVFFAGILLTAFSVGIGVLLLIVGLMVMLSSGIMLITAGGYRTEGFFALGWKNSPVHKVNLQKGQDDKPLNPWDAMTADGPEEKEAE